MSNIQYKTRYKSYQVWRSMKKRCYNKKTENYIHYGGRGIKVCDRWLESFWNFLEDMGEAPAGFSIERIDNDGNYEKPNCKWATNRDQNMNRRLNKRNTSGYSGVCWNPRQNKWLANIGVYGKVKFLGHFDNIEDAIKARLDAEAKYRKIKR